MRDTLICTTGTSLIEGNLRRLSETSPGRPDNWSTIRARLEEGNWISLANELLKLDPRDRVCGADINTVEEARGRSMLELRRLHFLVSDTPFGRDTGNLFRQYFRGRRDLDLEEVDFTVVEGLQDKDTTRFKTQGLRNLVRCIGDVISRQGRDRVAIDATGGYKAQIAFAVLIGQALDLPVFYKHERFAEIIDFPPMPVSLDFDILGRNADILSLLEKGDALERKGKEPFDEKLRVFLTEVSVGGETLYELNPMGQLYLTSFRLRHPKSANLRNLTDDEREVPSFPPHHMSKSLMEHVTRVWEQNRWIKTCITIEYGHVRAIKGKRSFFVKQNGEETYVVGAFLDEANHPGQFRIFLSDEGRESQNWAANRLNELYGG